MSRRLASAALLAAASASILIAVGAKAATEDAAARAVRQAHPVGGATGERRLLVANVLPVAGNVPGLGRGTLTPARASIRVGARISYSLAWVVPAPLGWRSLNTLQLRFRDGKQTALWVRFQEVSHSPGTFSIADPKTGKSGHAFAPGSARTLKTGAATLYLAKTSVRGPPGRRVTIRLSISFNGRAAGHTYDVQVLAMDDTGAIQGFQRAATVAVAQ
jgi:hypothetical protein